MRTVVSVSVAHGRNSQSGKTSVFIEPPSPFQVRRFPPHTLDHPHSHERGDLEVLRFASLSIIRLADVGFECSIALCSADSNTQAASVQILTVRIDFHDAYPASQYHHGGRRNPIAPRNRALSRQPDTTDLFSLSCFHRFFRNLCFSRGSWRIWNTTLVPFTA